MILGWFRLRVWDLRNEHQNVRSKFQAQSADGFVSPERPLWIPDQARLQLSDTVETCGQWHKMLETCGNYSTIFQSQYSSIFINIHQYSNIFHVLACLILVSWAPHAMRERALNEPWQHTIHRYGRSFQPPQENNLEPAAGITPNHSFTLSWTKKRVKIGNQHTITSLTTNLFSSFTWQADRLAM